MKCLIISLLVCITAFISIGCSGAANNAEFRKSGPTRLKKEPTRTIRIIIPPVAPKQVVKYKAGEEINNE